MTVTNAPPSTNPANLRSLVGLLNTVLTKTLQGVDGRLPAEVISYDRATNRARVQPLITMVNTNKQQIPRAAIASVPVQLPGGGGFAVLMPLRPGDLGWIEASDRDISLFLQTYKQARPNTYRVKNFADAVFVPDVMTGYTISEGDADNLVLQSLNGSVKISLGSNAINITAPNIVLNGTTTINGDFNVAGTNTTALGAGGAPIALVGSTVQVDIVTGAGTVTASTSVNTSI